MTERNDIGGTRPIDSKSNASLCGDGNYLPGWKPEQQDDVGSRRSRRQEQDDASRYVIDSFCSQSSRGGNSDRVGRSPGPGSSEGGGKPRGGGHNASGGGGVR